MANKFVALVLGLAILASPAMAQDDGPPRPQLPPLALNAQMTDAQIAMLTSNVFLAAWLGKHWLTGLLCVAYTVAAILK